MVTGEVGRGREPEPREGVPICLPVFPHTGLHPGPLYSIHQSDERGRRYANCFLALAWVRAYYATGYGYLRTKKAGFICAQRELPAGSLSALRCVARRLEVARDAARRRLRREA